jgi:tetratricopeptide (TPR) repeat protein/predicted Ser/Thr protein kinase
MPEFRPSLENTVAAAETLSGTVGGRFLIGKLLGKGGMGEVYRCEDTRLKRSVALKRLAPHLRADPVYRRRFLKEAEHASRFTDSHVAAIHDVLEEKDEILLVMEYVEGENLRQRLQRRMSLEEFLDLAVQCVEALVAAHDRDIVHCDIKPENIMLTTNGQVKILDFGVAKHLPRADQSSTLDRSGTVGGTPAYMSPEVLLAQAPDARADIFSLGVVFYETLTGHHPFIASSFVATSDRILHETPAPIHTLNSKVPEQLEEFVSKAMAKEPSQRFANASELLETLHLVQAGMTPHKLLPVLPRPKQREPKRWLVTAVIVFIIATAGLGIYRWRYRPPILAARGWVLISDFDTAGNQVIPNAGLREGLTIVLQQSGYVNVYPRSRVYEVLQRMRKENVGRIDEVLGQEICRRENVQVLLAGSISQIGQSYQITVRALDPVRDKPLFAEKAQFDRKEEFFDKVDWLARRVRTDLGESLPAIEKTSRPLAKVTTRSLEALQLYSQATDAYGQGRMEQVPTLLQSTLTLDPEFAMAHKLMAEVYEIMGNRAEELEHLKRAYDLRDGLTERERGFIEASYYTATGRGDKTVEALTALVTLYPEDPEAHRDLAFANYDLGYLANSIQQLHQVIKLDPNSALAYARLVVQLARNNAPEEALKIYQEAKARGLASPGAGWGLGMALWNQGRVTEAQAEFRSLQEASPLFESIGRIYFARTLIYQGKLAAANEQFALGIRQDEAAKNKSPELLQRYLLAGVALTEGNKAEARRQLKLILAAGEPEALQAADLRRAGALYAQMGDVGSGQRILRKLEDLQAKLPSSFNRACRDNLAGEIALAEARREDAVQLFSESLAAYPLALSHQGLARAYEAQHDWPRAATEWGKFLDARGEVFQENCPTDWVLAHLSLARVYRHLDEIDEARAKYKKFLEIWRESDQLRFIEKVTRESEQMEGLGRPHQALGPGGPDEYGV